MEEIRPPAAVETLTMTPEELQRLVGEEIRHQRAELELDTLRNGRLVEFTVFGAFAYLLALASAGVAIYNALVFVMPGWAAGLVLVGIYALAANVFLLPLDIRIFRRR